MQLQRLNSVLEVVYVETTMVAFFLWLILLILCWPIAIAALILYPIVWLLLLPFRLIGIAVGGVFAFIKGLIMLPARVMRGPGTVR